MSHSKLIIISSLILLLSLACRVDEPADAPADPLGEPLRLVSPLGLPEIPVRTRHQVTAEAVSLGRRLFFDPNLSSDRTVSCASCHQPERWFTDGLPTAKGVGGQTGKRNTPSILNAVYWSRQFWDGRATDLAEQAGGPIANPIEMNLPHDLCLERLSADATYPKLFEEAFGPGGINMPRVVRAIAAFETTLQSGDSPFDRYYIGEEKSALSSAARRGLAVFRDPARGNCVVCHTIGEKNALFTDGLFHNLGTAVDANGEIADPGRYAQTGLESDRGAFRTPGLRNVARTAPYMHNGRLKNLREVIDFYIGGGSSNPQLDPLIKPLTLSAQERQDLEAFLESLTGKLPPKER
jgi:cytochrome c peroxidase